MSADLDILEVERVNLSDLRSAKVKSGRSQYRGVVSSISSEKQIIRQTNDGANEPLHMRYVQFCFMDIGTYNNNWLVCDLAYV